MSDNLVEQLAGAMRLDWLEAANAVLAPGDDDETILSLRRRCPNLLAVVATQVEAAVSATRDSRDRTVAKGIALARSWQARAEAAEAERDALREKVAKARQWIVNCVDPAAVGVEKKREMLAALSDPTTPDQPEENR